MNKTCVTQLSSSCATVARKSLTISTSFDSTGSQAAAPVPSRSTPIQAFHQPNPTPTPNVIRNLTAQDPEFLSELLCISSACVPKRKSKRTREKFTPSFDQDDIRKFKVLDALAQSCISDGGQVAAMAASIDPREPGSDSVRTTIYLVFNTELKQSHIDNTVRHLERILDIVRDMHQHQQRVPKTDAESDSKQLSLVYDLLTEMYDFGWSRFAHHVLKRADQFEIVKEAVLKDKEKLESQCSESDSDSDSQSFFASFEYETLESIFQDIDFIIEDVTTRNSTGRLPEDFIGLVHEIFDAWEEMGILDWDSILVKLDRFLSESTRDTDTGILFSMQSWALNIIAFPLDTICLYQASQSDRSIRVVLGSQSTVANREAKRLRLKLEGGELSRRRKWAKTREAKWSQLLHGQDSE
ncbi:hypothetical protein BT96DRAFT_985766 [Gymnopus androsaceus JB14]|uniref:Uncharacterized protein n=1 Tax=Gymnopus androsaceus JB14 TaxID=1447944 RepID=A0A6A4IIR8_9AGAR|nr:hypothetical protein BT96DRAFT_985766 [Gymnopus androsaceus JB14]